MGGGGSAAIRLLGLLLCLGAAAGVHHDGDFIHTARRAQFLKVTWHAAANVLGAAAQRSRCHRRALLLPAEAHALA